MASEQKEIMGMARLSPNIIDAGMLLKKAKIIRSVLIVVTCIYNMRYF